MTENKKGVWLCSGASQIMHVCRSNILGKNKAYLSSDRSQHVIINLISYVNICLYI